MPASEASHRSRASRRHSLGVVTATALATGLLAIAAPSASAVTTIPVTCTERSIPIYGTPGDEFTFSLVGSCNADWEFSHVDYQTQFTTWAEYRANDNLVVRIGWPENSPRAWWYAYFQDATRPASVTVQLMSTSYQGQPLSVGSTVLTIDNGMGAFDTFIPVVYAGPRAAAPADAAPAIIRQGLPVPADGTCTSVADAQYAWGTGLSGGWVKSWEPWVDGGKGGWACNRSLVNKGGNNWIIDNAA